MTDRDHFAAAALTGLMSARRMEGKGRDEVCQFAYIWADAMLRERERLKEKDGSTSYSTTSPHGSGVGGTPASAPESQSPASERGGGEPPGVPQPDNGLATGGRGRFLAAEERDAIANGASSLESEAMREWAGDSKSYMRRYAATLRAMLERTK